MNAQQLAQARQKAMRNTSIVGAITNTALTLLKIIFGFIGNSTALIADGLHSLADLSTDLMVLLAAKYSTQPADKEHPYGHARIETIFTVALGLVLIVTAGGIAIDASQRILNPEKLLQPAPIVLLIAFLSIIGNEALYQYTMRAARKVKSNLLVANAWHHRTDAISSIVVLIGVAGSLLNFAYLDAFAALGVALMIAKVGWDQVWSASRELIDTSLEPETVEAIKQAISEVKGVKSLHLLRTRKMAGESLIDVHIQVASHISVSEGHYISDYVRYRLYELDTNISDVLIHIDPEDDEKTDMNHGLPLRQDLIPLLQSHWHTLVSDHAIEHATLHYLSGKVHIDLYLPLAEQTTTEANRQLIMELKQVTSTISCIGHIRVFYTPQ